MSAWIMTNESINNIVNSIYWFKNNEFFKRQLNEKFKIDLYKTEDIDLNEELKKLGTLLIKLNQESINYRYNQKDKPFKFEYSSTPALNIFQFLKSVECYLYQSCEIENYEEDETYKFMKGLSTFIKDTIINELPLYNKAKWE